MYSYEATPLDVMNTSKFNGRCIFSKCVNNSQFTPFTSHTKTYKTMSSPEA